MRSAAREPGIHAGAPVMGSELAAIRNAWDMAWDMMVWIVIKTPSGQARRRRMG